MPYLSLPTPDLALFTDVEATRIAIPHLVVQDRSKRLAGAVVQFEGDTAPTPFTGEAVPRTYELTARYVYSEHEDMAALVALLDAAHAASDSRLMLRTNARLVEALNRIEVGVAFEYAERHIGGQAWDVGFSFATVNYTVAV